MTQVTKSPRYNVNLMTQAQYDAATKEPNQLYVIVDGNPFSSMVYQDVVDALGYAPYDSDNSSGFISGVTSEMVEEALQYVPENKANKVTTIDSSSTDLQYPSALAVYDAIQGITFVTSLSELSDVSISSPAQGENLTYDSVLGKWKNTMSTATVAWGGITGALSDQTDLQNALNEKATKFYITNPALSSYSNVCTWNITNVLETKDVQVSIYEVATGKEILAEVTASNSTISVELISSDNITAGTYEAVIVG